MPARQLFEEFRDGGEAFFLQAKEDQREETLFLDFKEGGERLGDGKQAGTGKLSKSDRENLAKVLSGFANSEGGVAVWGVKCKPVGGDSPDVVQALVPVLNARRFLTDL